ncbi:ABC transporter permease [Reticulibacter mediterranei]|uniref:ABC transporter permease n=1 Tax=Reticulibacter mediterranei TaxID=2778369 RepID=A0A8J3N0K7_9CHLR|nr:sugar ABC transporter permease [Reticulibacter mediterranei]GHO90377.1 ABC transporter permease [Reticulibacter mediterranei]
MSDININTTLNTTQIVARSRRAQRRRQALIAYAFLAPSLVIFLIFRHLPALASLILGFFDWSMLAPPQFVGLDNYINLFHDAVFWRSLGNTALFTVMTVPTDILISLGLALLINQKLPGMRIFRMAYFIPVVTATAIVAVVWRWLYQPSGLINEVLQLSGLSAINWLSDPRFALPAIAIMAVWKHVGFNMLIFLAGLQSIPAEIEEAAHIDGAGRWATFSSVILPLLRPVILLAVILTTIGSFQVFDAAYVMTNGGPVYATTTLVFYAYQQAFDQYSMGYAAAIAFVLFVIILVISLLQRLILKGDEDVY